ncbi:hypothetical protein J2W35_003237 [Variovorax boronicumulans]|uniref:hypothetical protein n=1 Tax=Variovorax boronicumulans TaxID=436515 RepID=UPI002787ABA8|nr:hypothetical protein [Variovorax boronicumulans]MDQ0082878.1 hypothetical protein [Variovorax boronicumulans]
MRERPILFSAPMVRALLDGTKTQTRRVMKRQKRHAFTDYTLFGQRGHSDDEAARRGGWAQPWVAIEHAPDWPDGQEDQCHCPYARERGDRLWVRETWGFNPDFPGMHSQACFRADTGHEHDGIRWVPSIHMPRVASRIELEVTDVRIERLQDISEADARAEGYSIGAPPCRDDPLGWYRSLWEQINGAGSWDANPWVWVVEFRRVKP